MAIWRVRSMQSVMREQAEHADARHALAGGCRHIKQRQVMYRCSEQLTCWPGARNSSLHWWVGDHQLPPPSLLISHITNALQHSCNSQLILLSNCTITTRSSCFLLEVRHAYASCACSAASVRPSKVATLQEGHFTALHASAATPKQCWSVCYIYYLVSAVSGNQGGKQLDDT
jgi:hypothetical protein